MLSLLNEIPCGECLIIFIVLALVAIGVSINNELLYEDCKVELQIHSKG